MRKDKGKGVYRKDKGYVGYKGRIYKGKLKERERKEEMEN